MAVVIDAAAPFRRPQANHPRRIEPFEAHFEARRSSPFAGVPAASSSPFLEEELRAPRNGGELSSPRRRARGSGRIVAHSHLTTRIVDFILRRV
jgi:hypothetical protein